MKLKNEIPEQMLTAYAAGEKTLEEIGKEFGVSPSTVSLLAQSRGLPHRKRGRRTMTKPTPEQEVILKLAQTESYESVGQKFGLAKERIGNLMVRWYGPSPKLRAKNGMAWPDCPRRGLNPSTTDSSAE